MTDPLRSQLSAEEQAMLTLANDSLTAKSSYLDVPVILTALAEARQELHAAEQTITQLLKDRDAAVEEAAHKAMDAFNLSQRLDTVQQQRQQARVALEKYGTHHSSCGWFRVGVNEGEADYTCNCGLDATLTTERRRG